jgi:hypothetical protein
LVRVPIGIVISNYDSSDALLSPASRSAAAWTYQLPIYSDINCAQLSTADVSILPTSPSEPVSYKCFFYSAEFFPSLPFVSAESILF